MTTERRRHTPAWRAKIVTTWVSVAGLVGLVGVAAQPAAAAGPEPAPAPTTVHVVITDDHIDRNVAVRAALDALARGLDHVQAPTTATAPSTDTAHGLASQSHSTSHAS